MQHKFCVIDDAVLIIGTLDWGNDLTSDNWNYVYITSKPQLVEPVKREFYNLWNECQISILAALRKRLSPVVESPPKLMEDNETEEENPDDPLDKYEVVENVPENVEGKVEPTRDGSPEIWVEGTATEIKN